MLPFFGIRSVYTKSVGKHNPAYPTIGGLRIAHSERISSRSAHVWIIYNTEMTSRITTARPGRLYNQPRTSPLHYLFSELKSCEVPNGKRQRWINAFYYHVPPYRQLTDMKECRGALLHRNILQM